jgi:hypothetical protein
MEKQCRRCLEMKPLEEFYRQQANPCGRMHECKDCNKTSRAAYRAANREKERQRNRKYHAENPEVVRSRVKRWRKNNPGKERAKAKMREAQQIKACPPWAKKGEIKEQICRHYLHAEWLESVTGTPMHVDHIVPLRNDFVCGLHVPANLMVLSAEDNISKNAYWWPEQLSCQTGKGSSHPWWQELKARIDCGEKN